MFHRILVPCLVLSLTSAAVGAPVDPKPQPAKELPKPEKSIVPGEAKKISDAFVAAAERVSPSVVQIDVTSREDREDTILRWNGRGGGDNPVSRGTGSGVIVSPDGAILTNNHVLDDALSINVRLHDGRYLPAKFVGRDPSTDLAVIKIDATGLTVARLGDSEAIRVGEWVVAVGSPFGLGYTVTGGLLSAKGRGGLGMNAIEDYLQTDASINPGNSGGPLCDLEGRVIGINSMIVGRGSGIGFAVPIHMARKVAEQLIKTGRVERSWLGVGIQDLTPELASMLKTEPKAGVLINSVSDNGPGQKANLRSGDVIVSLGGKAVHDTRELIREVLSNDVGKQMPLEVMRDGKRYGSSITLAARPETPVEPLPVQQQSVPQPGLGLTVRDLGTDQVAQLGLGKKVLPVISAILPGSPADRAGLRTNDVIVEADGGVDPNSARVQEAAKDGQLLLRVKRKQLFFYAALRKETK